MDLFAVVYTTGLGYQTLREDLILEGDEILAICDTYEKARFVEDMAGKRRVAEFGDGSRSVLGDEDPCPEGAFISGAFATPVDAAQYAIAGDLELTDKQREIASSVVEHVYDEFSVTPADLEAALDAIVMSIPE